MAKRVVVPESAISVLRSSAEDLAALCEEMSAWRDNLEERFSSTEKYQLVSDAVDALDEVSDLDAQVDAIETAIDLLVNGREAVTPCTAHTIGTPCDVCGWNGEGVPAPQVRKIRIGQAPYYKLGGDMALTVVGEVGRCYTFGTPSPARLSWLPITSQVNNYATEAEAVAARDAAAERVRAKYPPVAPPLRKAVEPFAALAGAESFEAAMISMLPPLKRRSRADRCADAVDGGQRAIEALRDVLAKLEEGGERTPEQAEQLDEIRAALDEFARILDDAQGVEFPGAF